MSGSRRSTAAMEKLGWILIGAAVVGMALLVALGRPGSRPHAPTRALDAPPVSSVAGGFGGPAPAPGRRDGGRPEAESSASAPRVRSRAASPPVETLPPGEDVPRL